jgi:hypothetical protein
MSGPGAVGGRTTKGDEAPAPWQPPTGHHPVRAVGIVVVLLVVGALSGDMLGDLTQTAATRCRWGSRSEIVLDIDTRDYRQDRSDGARALWAACAGTTGSVLVDGPASVPGDGDRVCFSVEPGLGRNNRRKLVGCLEDATIDRLQGTVVSVELIEPSR